MDTVFEHINNSQDVIIAGLFTVLGLLLLSLWLGEQKKN
jgi:hypothetical protein